MSISINLVFAYDEALYKLLAPHRDA